MKVKTLLTTLALLGGAGQNLPARADNPLSNIVKDVMDVTGKAVKGTAHGAAAVVQGTGNVVRNTAEGTGNLVRNTAEGTGNIVRNTAHGAEAMVGAAERAVGINTGSPAQYHPPVAGQAPLSTPVATPVASSVPATVSVPQSAGRQLASLPAGTISIAVDRHGNIVDSSGKLIGRVSTISTDTPPEFGGQRFNVTVNGVGELVDASSRVIGHVLGAEPALMPKATGAPVASAPVASAPVITAPARSVPAGSFPVNTSPAIVAPLRAAPVAPAQSNDANSASSWTEDDILKNTAPLMRGLN